MKYKKILLNLSLLILAGTFSKLNCMESNNKSEEKATAGAGGDEKVGTANDDVQSEEIKLPWACFIPSNQDGIAIEWTANKGIVDKSDVSFVSVDSSKSKKAATAGAGGGISDGVRPPLVCTIPSGQDDDSMIGIWKSKGRNETSFVDTRNALEEEQKDDLGN